LELLQSWIDQKAMSFVWPWMAGHGMAACLYCSAPLSCINYQCHLLLHHTSFTQKPCSKQDDINPAHRHMLYLPLKGCPVKTYCHSKAFTTGSSSSQEEILHGK
jgi:hypothetical protein